MVLADSSSKENRTESGRSQVLVVVLVGLVAKRVVVCRVWHLLWSQVMS